MPYARSSIADFELSNPFYIGATISFFTIDVNGNKTTTLANLYSDTIGTEQLPNPQLLDSFGKFSVPVYIQYPVIGTVSGGVNQLEAQDTGVISVPGRFRGTYDNTVAIYYGDDLIQDPATGIVYSALTTFAPVSLTNDISLGKLAVFLTPADLMATQSAEGFANAAAASAAAAATSAGTAGSSAAASTASATISNTAATNSSNSAVSAAVSATAAAASAAAAAASTGFSTGDVKMTIKTAADATWIMCNDGTIGNAASGGTNRANADTQALYVLVWNTFSNAIAPVTGGRGLNALADFNANKPLQILSMLGKVIGLSGAGAGLTVRTLGETVGDENLQTHTHTTNDPGHVHPYNECVVGSLAGAGSNAVGEPVATNTGSSVTGITINDAGTGTGGNMQPTIFLNAMIKL